LKVQNWEQIEKNQEKNLNMLLWDNVILAARQKQKDILTSSPISTHRQK
jgi:hypothetical protein